LNARSSSSMPVLWHLDVSHYNEKVRWALDFKGIAHTRRAIPPGIHMAVATAMARQSTLPVLVLEGRAIGDSTAIIEALERRHPDPPLYPAERDLRQRALELEEYFDEQLGPEIRRVFLYHLFADPALSLEASDRNAGPLRRALLRPFVPVVVRMLARVYGVDRARAEEGLGRTHAVLDRIVQETGPSGYLVGDRFTVADLTAAALGRLLAPAEYVHPVVNATPALQEVRESLRSHPAVDWIEAMHIRHRGTVPRGSRTSREEAVREGIGEAA
jgi:glutathione S-transferase